jgi:hypothetical protein
MRSSDVLSLRAHPEGGEGLAANEFLARAVEESFNLRPRSTPWSGTVRSASPCRNSAPLIAD